MDGQSPLGRARTNAAGIASLLVTGVWMAAMFTGQDWWLAALIVGYAVVVPLVGLLFGDESDEADHAERTDERSRATRTAGDGADETALERLRRRYAEGELTDEQFERKLERLLETESLEDVEDRARPREIERERDRR